MELTLESLIESVHGETDLERLGAAVTLGQDLGEKADNLVGHFVDRARAGGCSWTEIGGVLSVTKQAAQKRFVPRGGMDTNVWLASAEAGRYTERARRVVELAERHAKRLGHGYLGTEHLLLGLLEEGHGVGAKAIEALGLSLRQVADAVMNAVHASPAAVISDLPLTPLAKKVFELAIREALKLGHNYIGTEHQLLALVEVADGIAATVLAELGVTAANARREVVRLLSGFGK